MKIKTLLACSLLCLQMALPVWASENSSIENWQLPASTSQVLLVQERDHSQPLLSLAQTEPMGEFELGTGKSRWLAGGLSLLVPGAGQFYNEDYVFGSIYAVSALGLFIAVLMSNSFWTVQPIVIQIGLLSVSLASSIHAGVQTSEIQLIRF